MPVAPQVRSQFGDDHEVALADADPAVAAGAQIPLAGCVGLHGGGDLYAERAAHSTSATVARMVPATKATSTSEVRWGRNGLKPMASHRRAAGAVGSVATRTQAPAVGGQEAGIGFSTKELETSEPRETITR